MTTPVTLKSGNVVVPNNPIVPDRIAEPVYLPGDIDQRAQMVPHSRPIRMAGWLPPKAAANDIDDIRPYLKNNEKIVPQNVLSAFFNSFDTCPFLTPKGVALCCNYLAKEVTRNRFILNMKARGMSPGEIERYLEIFSKPRTIIISNEMGADGKTLKTFLMHERFHQELKKLPRHDYLLMRRVGKRIQGIRIPRTGWIRDMALETIAELEKERGKPLSNEEREYFLTTNIVDVSMKENPEEVFTYTATEKGHEAIEAEIKRISHPAYRIFLAIKDRVHDLENYDPDTPVVNYSNYRIP